MLMLQALLPVMLAKSATLKSAVRVTLQGGTNVCSPRDGKVTAPQVEYMQLVLFPMLRRLFGVNLEMDVHKKGFLGGGGEVVVRASAPYWPLPCFELLDCGAVRSVSVSGSASFWVWDAPFNPCPMDPHTITRCSTLRCVCCGVQLCGGSSPCTGPHGRGGVEEAPEWREHPSQGASP